MLQGIVTPICYLPSSLSRQSAIYVLFLQFRLSLYRPLNVGTYRSISRTLGDSSSSTPLGKRVFTSRCSFIIFLLCLDKGCHIITMVFPDSRDFITPIYSAYIHIHKEKLNIEIFLCKKF